MKPIYCTSQCRLHWLCIHSIINAHVHANETLRPGFRHACSTLPEGGTMHSFPPRHPPATVPSTLTLCCSPAFTVHHLVPTSIICMSHIKAYLAMESDGETAATTAHAALCRHTGGRTQHLLRHLFGTTAACSALTPFPCVSYCAPLVLARRQPGPAPHPARIQLANLVQATSVRSPRLGGRCRLGPGIVSSAKIPSIQPLSHGT